MKVNIFFHKVDNDGKCSGAIIKYSHELKEIETKLWPFNYGENFPYKEIPKEETIIFVDVAPTPYSEIEKIKNEYNDLIIIDHHKTFIEYLISTDFSSKGKIEIGKAACELAWEYFFPRTKIPESVKLIGRYDVWDKTDFQLWNEKIMPFQYGLKGFIESIEKDYEKFKILFEEKNNLLTEAIIKEGKIIIRYQDCENKKYLDSFGFESNIEGLRALCFNSVGANSRLFESQWDENKYDIMMVFVFDGQSYHVSLYTTKLDVDVSSIAKKYGGGGHKQASGFQIDDIFKVLSKE